MNAPLPMPSYRCLALAPDARGMRVLAYFFCGFPLLLLPLQIKPDLADCRGVLAVAVWIALLTFILCLAASGRRVGWTVRPALVASVGVGLHLFLLGTP